MKKDFVKEYFSIPNLMGYFRLLLVPVYLIVYVNAQSKRDYYIAAGIMLVSFLTDLFDGKIARKFNMVTDFGKILDPVADKITQGVLVLSFTYRYPAVTALLIVFLVKELIMAVVGAYMLKQGHRMNGAAMHGKICTTVIDITMFILLVIPDIPYMFVNILIFICIVFILISLWKYGRTYLEMWKLVKEEKKIKDER